MRQITCPLVLDRSGLEFWLCALGLPVLASVSLSFLFFKMTARKIPHRDLRNNSTRHRVSYQYMLAVVIIVLIVDIYFYSVSSQGEDNSL